jgi:Tfp pilus assembly protein PilO
MDLSDQKTQITFLVIAGVIGALYLWFTYLYTPRNDRINELETQKNELINEIQALQIEVAKLPRVEAELAETRAHWNEVLISFPTEPREEEVFASFTEAEQTSGIYIVEMNKGASRTRPLYIEQDFVVNMVGQYQELGRFIAELGSKPRRISVERMKLTHPDALSAAGGAATGVSAQEDEVVITCTITTYIVRQGSVQSGGG